MKELEGVPTFDLETIHWSIPIAVGFFDGYGYTEFIKESEDEDVVWKFLSYLKEYHGGIKLYAHCASKFDNKFILASLCQHSEAVSLEAGLMRLRWKGPNITFEDSYPIVPMSLERMNKMFGVEEKGEWKHEMGLSPWEMNEKLPTFKAYLRNDCISLSHSMYRLCEMLGTTFGQMPSISLATTSAKVFDRCFYPVDSIEPNEEFEEFIRKAIYGGRNEVYRRYGENINMYDIHWMYTSCYDTPVPTGKMRWTKENIDRGTLAEATVKVPKDWYLGPLPKKIRGKLTFPVGEFTDWWDMRELRNAAEMGIDIAIRRQLYCEEEPVLETFGKFVSKLRNTSKDLYWKVFGLSLSGKFGQGRWRDSVRHISDIKDMKGYTPLDEREEYFVTKEYSGRRAPYIKPLVAMRIRAEARIRHLKIILDALKSGEIFYGDTDSIFTTATLTTGKEVGDLVYIGKAERGYFVRQKLYGIIQEGRLTQKSAGYSDVKLSENDLKNLLDGKNLNTETSLLTSYRATLSERDVRLLTYARQIKGEMGDNRIPIGNDSQPICLPLS